MRAKLVFEHLKFGFSHQSLRLQHFVSMLHPTLAHSCHKTKHKKARCTEDIPQICRIIGKLFRYCRKFRQQEVLGIEP